jgi:hypothetical protein
MKLFAHWYGFSIYSKPTSFGRDSALPFEKYIRKGREYQTPGLKIEAIIEGMDIFDWRNEPEELTFKKILL